jgi:hypothetical protein
MSCKEPVKLFMPAFGLQVQVTIDSHIPQAAEMVSPGEQHQRAMLPLLSANSRSRGNPQHHILELNAQGPYTYWIAHQLMPNQRTGSCCTLIADLPEQHALVSLAAAVTPQNQPTNTEYLPAQHTNHTVHNNYSRQVKSSPSCKCFCLLFATPPQLKKAHCYVQTETVGKCAQHTTEPVGQAKNKVR